MTKTTYLNKEQVISYIIDVLGYQIEELDNETLKKPFEFLTDEQKKECIDFNN
jgi:hypothetical protein